MENLRQYGFFMPTRVQFGPGASNAVGEEAQRLNATKALVITDKGIVGAGLLDPLTQNLSDAGVKVEVFDEVKSNPRDQDCANAAELGKKQGCDLLVGLGGGSAMDSAKVVGVLMTHPGMPKDYLLPTTLERPITPLITIPTTAGTGAEITAGSVISVSIGDGHWKKDVIGHELMAPTTALVDPVLCRTMPPRLTAETGLDALSHAVEGYTSTLANPFADAFALQAIELVGQNLRKAVQDGNDLEARAGMSYAATLSIATCLSSDAHGVHSLGEALGGWYDLPHGLTCGLFLPYVFEFNIPSSPARHARVARQLGVDVAGLSDEEAAAKGVEALKTLYTDLGLPRMSDIPSVRKQDFPALARLATENICAPNQPVETGEAEYVMLLERAYAGE